MQHNTPVTRTMTDRPSQPPQSSQAPQSSIITTPNQPAIRADGTLLNLAGGLVQNPLTGQGVFGRDSSIATTIGRPDILTEYDLRVLRENDWLIARVIEMPAEDMTKAGIDLSITDGDVADKAAVMDKWAELEVDDLTCEAEELSRQFGQSYIVIRANGNEALDKPLKPDRVRSIESLWVYDRYQLKPHHSEWNKIDPEYFELVTTYGGGHLLGKSGQPLSFGQKIHKSRVLRFRGAKLPSYDRNQNEGCDRSYVQRMFTAWKRYQSASASINEAINSFSLFTIAISNLSELISAEKLGEVKDLIREINLSRSLYGTMVLDGSVSRTEFQNRGGLSGVEGLFNSVVMKELTAASGLPHYKVWQEVAKAGLADDGGAESKAYDAFISTLQNRKHRKNHRRLLEMIMNAVLGRIPEDWSHSYNPLYTPPQKEQAEIFEINARSYKTLADIPGVVEPEEIRQAIGSDQSLADAIDLDEELPEDEDEDDSEELEAEETESRGLESDDRSDFADYRADDALWDTAAAMCWGKVREDDENSNRLYFFEQNGKKRRTGIISTSAKNARKKCRRGCGRVYAVRKLTTAEKKVARRGGWVRSGASSSQKSGYGGLSGYGPALKKRKDSTDDRLSVLTRDDATGQFILIADSNTQILSMPKNSRSDSDAITLDDLWHRFDSENEPTDRALWQRCVAEAKRKMKVWPSAYGSLFASKLYRSKGGRWKVKKDAAVIDQRSDSVEHYLDDLLSEIDTVLDSIDEAEMYADDLQQWLREKWVRVSATTGEILPGTCGDRDSSEGYPKCIKLSVARNMTPQERIAAVKRKRSKVGKNHTGKPIHVPTKADGEDDAREDAIRLSDLPTAGSRVRYKGRLYVPNKPYRQGDRFVVLAVRNGYVKLVQFRESDVDLTQEWTAVQPQYWANLYMSFGQPDTVEEIPEEDSRGLEKPDRSSDDNRTDAEAIEISGSDEVLSEAELGEEGAIDLLQTLEEAIAHD